MKRPLGRTLQGVADWGFAGSVRKQTFVIIGKRGKPAQEPTLWNAHVHAQRAREEKEKRGTRAERRKNGEGEEGEEKEEEEERRRSNGKRIGEMRREGGGENAGRKTGEKERKKEEGRGGRGMR